MNFKNKKNMDGGKDIFVSKFVINEQILYAKISCKPNEHDLFKIEIFCQNQSWSGNFSLESAKIFAENVEESEDDYFKNMLIALKAKEDTYVLDFTPETENSDLSKFVWKRKIPKEYSKHGYVRHGHVMVKKNLPDVTMNIILEHLMFQNETLQSLSEDYKKNCERLSMDLDNCRREFNKMIDVKNSIEANLYGKFIQVLNSKKKRIKLLESLLDNYQKNGQCNNDKKDED